MAGAAQPAEQVASLLHNLKVDSPSKVGESAEASPNLHSNASEGNIRALALVAPADVAFNAGVQESAMESSMYYTPAGYANPHGFYYESYEYPAGEWDDFSNHLGFDGVEIQTPWDLPVQSVYDENGSVVYHTAGYSFAAQPMYGPYAPGTPIPTMGADGQLYGAQPYPYSGHLYHQPALPAAQFIPCASSVVEAPAPTSSVGDPLNLGGEITNHTFVNVNGVPAGSNPGYPVALVPLAGPYGQGVLPVNAPIQGPLEARAGYEGIRASTSWSDTRVTGGQQRHGMSQPLPPSSLSGQLLRPVTPMLTQMPAGQQHGPSPDVTGTAGTFSRVYQPSPRTYSGSNTLGRLGQGLGSNSFEPGGNGHSWTMIDRGKPRGQGNGMMGDGNGTLDILNEQNRGPRTARIRNQGTTTGVMLLTRGQGVPNGTLEGPSALANKDQYNRSDFLTKYDMAKFFVIKSYSEDDVHKSIKYNVWASTPNGNKKLEAAYQEAHQKSGHCPIFLFFSVNASGQFCGVAEMVGPVDFNKSMDFWQQDKWSGKFPVKWHIIKDVPNNQFRHIILENNDNKPVTNSRDTQEVRLDQGVEMLNLFKNYIFRTSILDDFQFYENRQKAMQEKRARQQAYQQQQQGFAYRAINEYEPRRTSDETQGKSLEGKLVEAGDKGDKSGKNKDLEIKSSTYQPESSDKGVSSSDKPLPRSLEKRESLQSNGAKTENMSKTFPDKQ